MSQRPVLEATVTSKGQITLPKALREQLGLKKGSRIRFRVDERGRLEGDPVLLDLEDLWAMADHGPRSRRTLSTASMDKAKAETLVIVVDRTVRPTVVVRS